MFKRFKELLAISVALSMVFSNTVFAEPIEESVEEIAEETIEVTEGALGETEGAQGETEGAAVEETTSSTDDVSFGDLLNDHPVMKDRSLIGDIKVDSISNHGDFSPNVEIVGDDELPEKYVVPKEYLTPNKNQKNFGTCWTFGATAAIESNVLKQGLLEGKNRSNLDLSELHIVNSAYRNKKVDPLGGTEGDISWVKDDYSEYLDGDLWLLNDRDERYFPNNVSTEETYYLSDYNEGNIILENNPAGEEWSYDFLSGGGNMFTTTHMLSNWIGPVYEEEQRYETTGCNFYRDTKKKFNDYYKKLIDNGVIPKDEANEYFGTALHATSSYMINQITNLLEEEDNQKAYITPAVKAENVDMIGTIDGEEDIKMIKTLIMKNGVVGASYYAADEDKKAGNAGVFLNDGEYAYYVSKEYADAYKEAYGRELGTNHRVAVVGWDDTYDVENFSEKNRPENPGAWLIKNSWQDVSSNEVVPIMEGDNIVIKNSTSKNSVPNGEKGYYETYFWLSYENAVFECIASYQMCAADKYDNNYTYDGTSMCGTFSLDEKMVISNVYTAHASEENETLNAVNIYDLDSNINVTIDIYKNPVSDDPTSGKHIKEATTEQFFPCAGMHTISVNAPVYLKEGDRFAIVVTLEKPGDYVTYISDIANREERGFTASSQRGHSFILYNGEWIDVVDYNNADMSIKGFTNNGVEQSGINYITYNVEHGYDEENPYYYVSGNKVTLKDPVMDEGYTFEGWYLDDDYTNPVSVIDEDSDEDIILYAKWKKAEEKPEPSSTAPVETPVELETKTGAVSAIITLETKDAKGNVLPTVDMSHAISTKGNKVVLAKAKDMPTVTGYTFKGWYNGKKKISAISAKKLKDMTISAIYTENTYSIQYKINKPKGSKVTGKARKQTKIAYNDKVTLVSGLTARVKANAKAGTPEVNYELAGWTSVKGGTTVEFAPGQEITQLKGQKKKDKKIILYSVWKEA